MVDWLLLPLSGNAHHAIAPWAYWHARCMVLGWGVLLPLGALAARYFKVTPRQRWPEQLDNKAWWHAHRTLQWVGVAAMSAGALLAWGQGSGTSAAARWHAWAGWALVALGWLQVVAGLHRGSKGGPTDAQLPGDHYDMTPHRKAFERLHKGLGWLAVLASVVVIALGLYLADAPRWMAVLLAGWWLLLALAAWHWQRQGRCVDTYQAIWGPDPRHPGNRLKPVGWGVRRPQP
jgi:Eukaryotic cytochrome b561